MKFQLTRTLSEVREFEAEHLGAKGIPNVDWPLSTGNDCLHFQLVALGVTGRSDLSLPAISIRAFLAVTPWERVKPEDVRAGDLALQQWDSNPDVDHIGFTYSRTGTSIRTYEANTSPRPGLELTVENRGIYEKQREVGPWLIGGLRPWYAPEASKVSAGKRAETRLVLGWLDKQLPAGVTRSKAGPGSWGPGDGVMGPVAWLQVQEWGDIVGLYNSPPYEKDGIPAGRSAYVYGEALKRAKAAARK